MQIVRAADDLSAAVESARRVARAAFGDDTLLLERLLESPRHIEVQVLADDHGHVIHLGERECTLQRRHQKVVEEAPSPAIDAMTRERLGRAACAAAASVDYSSFAKGREWRRRARGLGFWLVFFEIPYFEVKDVDPLEDHGVQCW
jgi:acetyl/propionyl-CoA carboxylase alpha subunit